MKTLGKLDRLEKALVLASEIEFILAELGMGAELLEFKNTINRTIDAQHRFLCETELPQTLRTPFYGVHKGE